MPDVRTDLSQAALVLPGEHEWVTSPQAGVERVMLDRAGDEVAVATSFVRYAAESRFPDHDHALGEEFIVLDGVFSDEHGDFPAGSYVRNPPGTHHAPFSRPGCTIWVKLRQFDLADRQPCVAALDTLPPATGSSVRLLHRYQDEVVQEITAAPGADVALASVPHVREVLVLSGELRWRDARLGALAWLRVPARTHVDLTVLAPCRLFAKTRPVYR